MPWSNNPGFCDKCGNPVQNPGRQAYCSAACRNKAYRERKARGERSKRKPIRKYVLSAEYKAWSKRKRKTPKKKGEE